MYDFDRPIRLVFGEGSPDTGGCWMSAISRYAGESWSDHPDCVCPVISRLCITVNDALSSDDARGRIIGPHLFEPIGTATDDASITEKRRWHLIDAAIRRFAPAALRFSGLTSEARQLESLPPVTLETRKEAAESASAAARAARASAKGAAARSAEDAAYAAEYAVVNIVSGAAANTAHASAHAARAAHAAPDQFIESVALQVVLELCAIGDRRPIEMACERSEMDRALQIG